MEGFIPAVAPASVYWFRNEHYASEEEFVYALADALAVEYRAIADAGFMLQVDDAVLWHEYRHDPAQRRHDRGLPAVGAAARRRAEPRAGGDPAERVRYHVCSGSGHGPHTRTRR